MGVKKNSPTALPHALMVIVNPAVDYVGLTPQFSASVSESDNIDLLAVTSSMSGKLLATS